MGDEGMNDERVKDHAIDRLLAEELGGIRPPDLEARILAASRRRSVDVPEIEPGRNPRRPSPRSVLPLSMALGAAAAAAAFLWISRSPTGSHDAEPQLMVAVANGRLEWHEGSTPAVIAREGQTLRMHPTIGGRFHTATSQPTKLVLHPLGRVHCTPGTVLEVQNMEWKEFGGGLAAGALTVSVVVGAAQWFGDDNSARAETGETLVMRNTPGASSDLTAGTTDLEKQLADAKRRIGELEEEVARKPQPPGESAADTPLPEPVFDPIIADSTYGDALKSVSWRVVGEAVFGYFNAQREIMELMERGEEIPTALAAEEERWESLMIAEVGRILDEAEIPGTNMTAKIHHPALGMNIMVAALTKAGTPLDARQREAVLHLTNRFIGEDRVRRQGYGEDELALERRVAEAEMAGRYFKQLRGLLTADQEKMFALKLSDRTRSDPFGSGFNWSQIDRTMVADSRQDLAKNTSRGYAQDLNLTQAQASKLRPLIDHWAKNLPAKWLDLPMDHCDRKGVLHIARVRVMARAQLELMRRMLKEVGLDTAQARRLRELTTAFIPFIRQR